MGSGQLVHNLEDFSKPPSLGHAYFYLQILFAVWRSPKPYAEPFMSAIHTALTSSKPLETTMTLFRHPFYKQAHPSPEHLLPLVVSVAATDDGDTFEDMYSGMDDGLGWGMFRWR